MSTAETRSPAPAAGLFRPDDALWWINREAVLLLTGPRALLLQTAHPLVAAGVAQHSRFRQEPLARLRRTLDAMLALIFGEPEQAHAAARSVARAHARVRGQLATGTATHPAGTPYSADAPELARWVHATLVDSARVGFEAFVRPLQPAERDDLVRQSNRIAEALGLPASHQFEGAEDFDAYGATMLAGPELEITPEARAIAASVLRPPIRLLPRGAADAATFAGVALIPADMRNRYALPWSPRRERAWRGLRRGVAALVPHLPARVRFFPQARRAEARLRHRR